MKADLVLDLASQSLELGFTYLGYKVLFILRIIVSMDTWENDN